MCLFLLQRVKRSNLFLQPTVALCTAQTWTETPTVGSHPVVGSKTTPREKTNNTSKARPERTNCQTTPDFCFLTEGKLPALEAVKHKQGVQALSLIFPLKGQHFCPRGHSESMDMTVCLLSNVLTKDRAEHLPDSKPHSLSLSFPPLTFQNPQC